MKQLLCGLLVLGLAGCAKDEPTPVAAQSPTTPATKPAPTNQDAALLQAVALRVEQAGTLFREKKYKQAELEATAALEASPKTQLFANTRSTCHLLRGMARFQLLLQAHKGGTPDAEAVERVRSDLREAKRIDPENTEQADMFMRQLDGWVKARTK